MSKVYVVKCKSFSHDYDYYERDEVIAVASEREKAYEFILRSCDETQQRDEEDDYFVVEKIEKDDGWWIELKMEKATSDLDNRYVHYIFFCIEYELDKLEMEDL